MKTDVSTRSVLAAVLATTITLTIAGCAAPTCEIDPYSRSLAGGTAVDCGHFEIGVDRSAGVECALRAQAAGHAFVMFAESVGRDSRGSTAWILTPGGRRFIVSRDDDPSGGSQVGARMSQLECGSAFVEQTASGIRSLNCTEFTPWQVVCGRQ